MDDIKICFVSPKIYPLLKNSNKEFIGGAEFQQALIGKYIHRKGYEVCYVSHAYANDYSEEIIDGMKVYKTYAEQEGLPIFRFIYPRLTSLWKALKKADCDIYYQRGAAAITGVVAYFCKIHGKKFIFSGANDSNFSPEVKALKYSRDKIIYKWGLRNSHFVLVQSKTQNAMLDKNFGMKGIVSYNVYPAKEMTTNEKYVLWVANIKTTKQPELFLALAKSLPKMHFIMVGGRVASCSKLYDDIKEKASRVQNLEFLGFQPLQETEKLFDGASVFVNTSMIHREGFPNTFLQSWSRGIPTISFFDIDHIITENDLGAIIVDIDDAINHVKSFMSSDLQFRENIQRYFRTNHLTESYLRILDALLKNPAVFAEGRIHR